MEAWTDPRFLVDVAWKIGSLGALVWLAIQQRIKANKDAVSALEQKHGLLESRVTRVEERMSAGPSHADLVRIHERLDAQSRELGEVARAVSGLVATAKALERGLDLLNEHHINRERA